MDIKPVEGGLAQSSAFYERKMKKCQEWLGHQFPFLFVL